MPSSGCMLCMPESPCCCSSKVVATCTESTVPSNTIFFVGLSVRPRTLVGAVACGVHPVASSAITPSR